MVTLTFNSSRYSFEIAYNSINLSDFNHLVSGFDLVGGYLSSKLKLDFKQWCEGSSRYGKKEIELVGFKESLSHEEVVARLKIMGLQPIKKFESIYFLLLVHGIAGNKKDFFAGIESPIVIVAPGDDIFLHKSLTEVCMSCNLSNIGRCCITSIEKEGNYNSSHYFLAEKIQ